MLWRKKKASPWYGGCRKKLIRRKTNLKAKETHTNKLKLLNTSNQKFIKTSDPLQPTQEENKPNDDSTVGNMEFIITRNSDEKKDSSGTDSSATIVSPKAVTAPLDLLLIPDKNDNTVLESISESHVSEKKLTGVISPTSPSKRQISCDISIDTNTRHMTLRSPPASTMLRSPPLRVCNIFLCFIHYNLQNLLLY